jgi:AmmeMemoRadiSam system protein B/AmmeMemoRadiSam system protein A
MASAEVHAGSVRVARSQRPVFSPEQKGQIVDAVGRLIRATLSGQPANFDDPTLGGIADVDVSGAFVSLKRGKHLRSCCGFLGTKVPVGKALFEAADRTAWEDVRFPPVSLSELSHLDMEVWLLFNQQPVQAEGEERIASVTVGKHGLTVARGPAHGLLLPGVAVDHAWDARRFLDQVCVKAGLHPTAWKDRATALTTFEGEAVHGRIGAATAAESGPRPFMPFAAHELQAFADHCLRNIAALLMGATPNYYLFGKSDGQVAAVVLTVRRPTGEDLSLSQISLRPGLPLQATLFKLAHAAAQALARTEMTFDDLENLRAGLAVFFDPMMHGTVADSDLSGSDGERRAILVVERSRTGLVLDTGSSAPQRLAHAVEQAKIRRPVTAAVFSLEALSTEPKVVVASVPRPVAGQAVRPPAVAGQFYPADPVELDQLVYKLIGERSPTKPWAAALVPHAGLAYSGRIAAAVLKRLRIPRTVIVLGPKHTPLGVDWAVAPHQTWSIPGRTVASDPELARRLAEGIPGLELDAAAHQVEHAIEVELPFLAALAPESRVVGIAVGDGDWESCCRFSEGLASVLRQQEELPLLVVSSDMNHFATDSENRRLDELALAALEGLDSRLVYETVTENSISMCGVLPAVIVLQTLRLLGRLSTAVRVSYGTSADVSGDTSRVVGYAGMLFN